MFAPIGFPVNKNEIRKIPIMIFFRNATPTFIGTEATGVRGDLHCLAVTAKGYLTDTIYSYLAAATYIWWPP